MIQLEFSPQDVLATRFAYSPLVELIVSYRLLKRPELQSHYRRWLDVTLPALNDIELPYLDALAASHHYIPDFVTPTPITTSYTIEDEIEQLLDLPTELIRRDIEQLIRLCGDTEIRQQFLIYPREMLQCLADDLRLYWQRALEPHWSQLTSVLEGDILYRARQLAIEGAVTVFSDLHPVLSYDKDSLWLDKPNSQRLHGNYFNIVGRGLQLVPTTFMEDHLMWQTNPDWSPMLIYSARGIGQWEQQIPQKNQSLELLIGEGRASVLQALIKPASTSEIAHRLELTAGAVSQHLDRLHRTGLVEPHRSGKRVYYHLTRRGMQLLTLFDGHYA